MLTTCAVLTRCSKAAGRKAKSCWQASNHNQLAAVGVALPRPRTGARRAMSTRSRTGSATGCKEPPAVPNTWLSTHLPKDRRHRLGIDRVHVDQLQVAHHLQGRSLVLLKMLSFKVRLVGAPARVDLEDPDGRRIFLLMHREDRDDPGLEFH